MHKSRLCAFVIDCDVRDLDAAARFWSRALGRELKPASPDSPRYRTLATRDDEPILLLQQVEHDSHVHLDIESDDIEADGRAARTSRRAPRRSRCSATRAAASQSNGQRRE